MTWADKVELDYYMRVQSLDKSGKVKNKDVAFAVREVTVDNMKLNCVVMRLENHALCVLMTNQESSKYDYAFGRMIIEQYGCRWSIEEKIRFEKQEFNYENVRVRSLNGIRNMMAIIGLITSFMRHLYWKKISIKTIELARVIKKEVRFEYYRITEGIRKLFSMRASPVFHYRQHYTKYFPKCYQLEFWKFD